MNALFVRLKTIYGTPPAGTVGGYLDLTAKSRHQLDWAVDHILAGTGYRQEWPPYADLDRILGLTKPCKADQDFVDLCAAGKVEMGELHQGLQRLAQNMQKRRRPQ